MRFDTAAMLLQAERELEVAENSESASPVLQRHIERRAKHLAQVREEALNEFLHDLAAQAITRDALTAEEWDYIAGKQAEDYAAWQKQQEPPPSYGGSEG